MELCSCLLLSGQGLLFQVLFYFLLFQQVYHDSFKTLNKQIILIENNTTGIDLKLQYQNRINKNENISPFFNIKECIDNMLNITMYITCFFLSGKPKRILAWSLWY